jgi:hypothetical protein
MRGSVEARMRAKCGAGELALVEEAPVELSMSGTLESVVPLILRMCNGLTLDPASARSSSLVELRPWDVK